MSDKYPMLTEGWAEFIIDTHVPLGKFMHKDGDKWIAIDNSTGDAWVETFNNEEEAVKWLEEKVQKTKE